MAGAALAFHRPPLLSGAEAQAGGFWRGPRGYVHSPDPAVGHVQAIRQAWHSFFSV